MFQVGWGLFNKRAEVVPVKESASARYLPEVVFRSRFIACFSLFLLLRCHTFGCSLPPCFAVICVGLVHGSDCESGFSPYSICLRRCSP